VHVWRQGIKLSYTGRWEPWAFRNTRCVLMSVVTHNLHSRCQSTEKPKNSQGRVTQICGCMEISQKMMPRSLVWDARTTDLPSFMTPHFMVLHTKFTMEACMCFKFLTLCSQPCSNAKLRMCSNMCVTKLSRFTIHCHISGNGA